MGRLWCECAVEDFDLLDLHQHNAQRYPVLLESLGGSEREHWDILLAVPTGLQARQLVQKDLGEGDFLARLDRHWQKEQDDFVARRGVLDRREASEELGLGEALPFTGGWFVFLSYELAGELEPSVSMPAACALKHGDMDMPVAMAQRVPAALMRHRLSARTFAWVEPGFEEFLHALLEDVDCLSMQSRSAVSDQAGEDAAFDLELAVHEQEASLYRDGFQRVQRYIRDGDVFQVNLARSWSLSLSKQYSAASLYRRLRRANPGPFAGLARFGSVSVLSSSPERLLRVDNGWLDTRPIAGTTARDHDRNRDEQLRKALEAHPKERAEHVMLIDLERNDLGRVCEPGSIEVDEMMALESYAHVHHLVSNVRGRLRPGITPGEVIRAMFPGGTITGCPKVRCMQIIAELEPQARGAYTGSMGLLNHAGDMDLNILIRTMVHVPGEVSFHAGAGLVADSVFEKELAETRSKARGLLRAVQA